MNESVEICIWDNPVNTWFELTYSSYLVLPRLFLQSMPLGWQSSFISLVEEIPEYLNITGAPDYQVTARKNGKYIKDKYSDYRRGKVELKDKNE